MRRGWRSWSGRTASSGERTRSCARCRLLCGGARPRTQQVIDFIDAHRAAFGVEPICTVLAEAAWRSPRTPTTHPRPGRPLRAACHDEQLKAATSRVFAANYRVYGAEKVWAQLHREGIRVARCTIERLMRLSDLDASRLAS